MSSLRGFGSSWTRPPPQSDAAYNLSVGERRTRPIAATRCCVAGDRVLLLARRNLMTSSQPWGPSLFPDGRDNSPALVRRYPRRVARCVHPLGYAVCYRSIGTFLALDRHESYGTHCFTNCISN